MVIQNLKKKTVILQQPNSKGPEYCNLTDKRIQNSCYKGFSKLQGNSKRQFSELRNKINDQKELFTKETEILKKNQILQLKDSMNEKNALESLLDKRADQIKSATRGQEFRSDLEKEH